MTVNAEVNIPEDWLERVSCGYCGSGRFRVHKKAGRYNAVKCRECGLIYTSPRVRQNRCDELYNLEYYQHSDASWTDDHLGSFRNELLRMEQYVKGRRLLEIGCGGGKFLYCASELNWDVTGQEISMACADHVRSAYGFTVNTETIDEMATGGYHFDAVVMFHVLEHVFKPDEFLTTCRTLLSDGGILVIGVPNIGSPDLILDKDLRKRILHLPYHNYHFTEKTLTAFLRKAGFRELLVDRGISKHLISYRGTDASGMPGRQRGVGASEYSGEPGTDKQNKKGFLKRSLKPIISRILPGEYLVVYAAKGS